MTERSFKYLRTVKISRDISLHRYSNVEDVITSAILLTYMEEIVSLV